MTEFDPNRPVSMTKPMPAAIEGPGNLAPQPFPAYAGTPQPPVGYAPAPVPQPYTPYATATTTVVQQSNAEIIVAWIFTALTLLYMLPWAIAASRRSTNSIIIAIVTFFVSWTILGWLVMLVLSCLGPTVYSTRSTTTFVALPPPPPAGMWAHYPTDPPHVRRWWDGRSWTAHTTTV